jgi:RNA polymerase sigma-70 factor (ECF subfamily)
MLAAIPHLRAFAMSLCGDVDQADDLVQEAILRGLSHLSQFEPGTNMRAWLFTILRNQFHTTYRKRRREVQDPAGVIANGVPVAPEQVGHLDLRDLWSTLQKLPAEQREALLLIGAEGLAYEEAAAVCGIAIGTIKSRVNRGRKRLAELMAVEDITNTADHA